ncbi:DUF3231 family protein [Niallia oryzisoli]|uniref:DUF3231 family protein n=1 Tax=Niallia oryzisoli TaxID=1737571 RepID=A0ABZ2CJR9_9BACI
MKNNPNNSPLTSAEIGKLWATYIGNSMSEKVLLHFFQHVEDSEIRDVIGFSLRLCQDFVKRVENIYKSVGHPIPIGFTDEDVNLEAPRLFKDEFYLHYLRNAIRSGISVYGVAVPLVTRKDIREFFIYAVDESMKLVVRLNELLENKAQSSPAPPAIPIPNQIDFVKKKSYFRGFIGEVRPLHALEIAHLYDNITSNSVGHALLYAFSRVAQAEKIGQLFKRGLEFSTKAIETYSHYLMECHLQCPPLFDHLVTLNDLSPFSDKLMLFHEVNHFSIRIRDFGNSIAVNGRHDLAASYFKTFMTVGLFVQEAGNLLVENGWMERMPEAPTYK